MRSKLLFTVLTLNERMRIKHINAGPSTVTYTSSLSHTYILYISHTHTFTQTHGDNMHPDGSVKVLLYSVEYRGEIQNADMYRQNHHKFQQKN